MRFLLIAALLPLTASFASTPVDTKASRAYVVLAEASRAAPEGLVLIRDTYEFENAKHPMTGFTPDSPGPHKLIVVLTGHDPRAYETEYGAHDDTFAPDAVPWRRPSPRRGTGWSSWRRQASRTSATPLAPR